MNLRKMGDYCESICEPFHKEKREYEAGCLPPILFLAIMYIGRADSNDHFSPLKQTEKN